LTFAPAALTHAAMTKKSVAEAGPSLRGPKLIKKAIEKGREDALSAPEPVAPVLLKKLTLPNGEAISPAMKELLKVDALWLGMDFDDEEGDIEAVTLEEAVEDFFGEDGPAQFGEACELFDADCIVIGGASEALRVLYVGEADGSGEYAVLTLSNAPEPWVALCPFDVWVAQELGVLAEGSPAGTAPAAYEAAAKELADATSDGRPGFASTARARDESEKDDEDEDDDDDDEDEEDDDDDEDAGGDEGGDNDKKDEDDA
jgi:hypothetical protein